MERRFDQSHSIRSMACNSHSLHTAHTHPPIHITSSWPCPMARNLSLSALNSDLSASFMRSLTGSEPGLRIKTTGEKGVLCCRMASKLITGGCTYLAEGKPNDLGDCTEQLPRGDRALHTKGTAHHRLHMEIIQTKPLLCSSGKLQNIDQALCECCGGNLREESDSRLAHCHCHIVHHRPVHPVHPETAQQEKLLEVCDIALIAHWQWDLLQSICVVPLARKESTQMNPVALSGKLLGKRKSIWWMGGTKRHNKNKESQSAANKY